MSDDFDSLSAVKKAHVRQALRTEFTKFFVTITSPTPEGWPRVSNEEFVEALADSLLDMGQTKGVGVALLQTLIHDLQDRVNQKLN